MKRLKSGWVLAIGAVVAVLAGCATQDTISMAERGQKSAPGFAETRAIAEEGFIYGLPIVMNYAVMHDFVLDKNSGQYKGPFNTIVNEARVFTYKDTSVITPNSDTPYSMLWLDLRAEPMVISVPAVEKGRYYSAMLCDGNTFNYGYIGSRATGNDAGDYLVVGPDWKGDTPAGIKKVFRSSTQFSLVIYRTQLFNPEDLPNVVKVQSNIQDSSSNNLFSIDVANSNVTFNVDEVIVMDGTRTRIKMGQVAGSPDQSHIVLYDGNDPGSPVWWIYSQAAASLVGNWVTANNFYTYHAPGGDTTNAGYMSFNTGVGTHFWLQTDAQGGVGFASRCILAFIHGECTNAGNTSSQIKLQALERMGASSGPLLEIAYGASWGTSLATDERVRFNAQ